LKEGFESISRFLFSMASCLISFFIHPQLVPSPKWKLVVDIGKPSLPALTTPSPRDLASAVPPQPDTKVAVANVAPKAEAQVPQGRDPRVDELVALLGEQMPHDPQSPYASHLQHFMSLRLMLLKPTRSKGEKEVEGILLSSFTSYKSSGREKSDIAVMIARDYTFLQQQAQPASKPQAQSMNSAPTLNRPTQPYYNSSHQAQGQPFNSHPQQVSMDTSNHSVVGIGQQPSINQNQQATTNMMEISNHSHVQLNQHPSINGSNNNHQTLHSQQQPHP
jgi:hypothetical protein